MPFDSDLPREEDKKNPDHHSSTERNQVKKGGPLGAWEEKREERRSLVDFADRELMAPQMMHPIQNERERAPREPKHERPPGALS